MGQLPYLPRKVGRLECSDFHDQIYALLSLVWRSGLFPIDYGESREDLSVDTLMFCTREAFISPSIARPSDFSKSRDLRDLLQEKLPVNARSIQQRTASSQVPIAPNIQPRAYTAATYCGSDQLRRSSLQAFEPNLQASDSVYHFGNDTCLACRKNDASVEVILARLSFPSQRHVDWNVEFYGNRGLGKAYIFKDRLHLNNLVSCLIFQGLPEVQGERKLCIRRLPDLYDHHHDLDQIIYQRVGSENKRIRDELNSLRYARGNNMFLMSLDLKKYI